MNGTAPVTPVLLSNGVSITPSVVSCARRTPTTVTAIGPGVLVVPLKANVIVPVPLNSL